MKKTFKKIMSVILALVSSFILCSVAFAGETASNNDSVNLVDAKIVQVPLKNRITFRQSPKSPEGITIELKYSDGTVITEKVVIGEDGHYVNGEFLEESVQGTVVKYGIKSAGLYLNKGKISISYKYLCLPTTISGLFNLLYNFF